MKDLERNDHISILEWLASQPIRQPYSEEQAIAWAKSEGIINEDKYVERLFRQIVTGASEQVDRAGLDGNKKSGFTSLDNPDAVYVINQDALFRLLDYEELKSARAAAKEARVWAFMAFIIAAASLAVTCYSVFARAPNSLIESC